MGLTKRPSSAVLSTLVIALAGCSGPKAPLSDDTGNDDSTTEPDAPPDPTDEPPSGNTQGDGGGGGGSTNRNVDILFVIDNTGSMGEEQLNLASSFEGFVAVLEAPAVRANYRIAFTTTDNGNPWCTGTGPEGGALVLSSCRERIADFTFGSGANALDYSQACTANCPQQFEIIQIQPTTTDDEATPRPHPWIESIEGVTNLPNGITTAQALSCFAPQGVNGCGFEAHLESMHKALQRTSRVEEASYGFLRDDAILVIVIVTDEVDCSYNIQWQDIFSRDGNKVFWSAPELGNPTSAVCWNAGVECTGGPDIYAECHSANFDIDGNPVPEDRAPADAVLHPLSRYVEYVQDIENQKKSAGHPAQEVVVALIAGVPENYPASRIFYGDVPGGTANDPNYQANFGIGPGCSSSNGEALPPVREREFAAAFAVAGAEGNTNNIHSICAGDFSDALTAIANQIRGQIDR